MARIATKPKTLNDLPAEMVCEVLRWLSLADLVNLKMTAKRYQQIVSDFKVKKLNVGDHETSDSYGYCPPTLFIHQFARSTLSHLQQLTIDSCPENFDLNQLNRLDRLVQLKIGYELPEGEEIHLNLPELRQLEVVCNQNRKMRINSTKLEKLSYYGYGNLLQVEHPETVVSLDSDFPNEFLSSFRNLLHLQSSTNLLILSERTLLEFPDLKEVAYTGTFDDLYYSYFPEAMNRIEDLSPFLERFMSKKKALGRTDLKVQFVSFELVDHKPIDDYRFFKFYYNYDDYEYVPDGPSYLFDLHIHNFNQLITAPFRDVNYLKLMLLFRGLIPDDFFSKFAGIESVRAEQLYAGEDHLLWFLQSLPALKDFQSDVANLSESFFRQLAENGSERLQSIHLGEVNLKRLQNVDFPGEFRALHFLGLEMKLSLEEIRWLLNMSWSSKNEFHLMFKYEGAKSKSYWPIQYDVKRALDSEEAFLFRKEDTDLRRRSGSVAYSMTCSVTCLNYLAGYFECL